MPLSPEILHTTHICVGGRLNEEGLRSLHAAALEDCASFSWGSNPVTLEGLRQQARAGAYIVMVSESPASSFSNVEQLCQDRCLPFDRFTEPRPGFDATCVSFRAGDKVPIVEHACDCVGDPVIPLEEAEKIRQLLVKGQTRNARRALEAAISRAPELEPILYEEK